MSRIRRLNFSASVRLQILCRAGWPEAPFCEGCGLPLKGKRIEVDHTIECWEKPDRAKLTIDDGQTLGECCHRPKTAEKAAQRAKGNRIIKKAAGLKKKGPKIRSAGFQTNRNANWKKPFGRNAVRREAGNEQI